MRDLHLRGIPEISKVYVQEAKIKAFDPETGAYLDKEMEWEILTDGTNLKDIFLVDKVNYRRVTSNDINQIYECLGIEAVRNTLIQELRKVLGHYGIYVNYRHLAVLCDVMTQCGYLTSITRHGINRVEQGPLRKCSFEETVEILLEAGLFAEVDHLKGISENIMLGQLAPYGTGCFDLIFDTDKIKNAEYLEDAKMLEDNLDGNNFGNEMATPDINYANNSNYSPTRTPFGMDTPNVGFNNSFTPMTVIRQSPIFTPSRIGGGKTPNMYNNFGSLNESDPVVNITSPYPYLRGMNTTSPGYTSNDQLYSPIYDSDANVYSKYNNSSLNNIYSPQESMPTKSPCINQAYSKYQTAASPMPYSPSSPMLNTGKQMSSSYGLSPTYNPLNSNIAYSPTTPIGHRDSSPEYSKGNFYSIRSNYSVSNSPKLNYGPNSPTYNPKSPAYNMSFSSKKFFFIYLILFYTDNIVSSPFYKADDSKKQVKRPLSPIMSDDEDNDK